MKNVIACAGISAALCVAAGALAYAGTSGPGLVGSGERHLQTVPAELQNAKPFPLPAKADVVLHADSNRSAVAIAQGKTIAFNLSDVGHGWTCSGGTVDGNSVKQLPNGLYQAVSPGSSAVQFHCAPPPPKPGSAGVYIRVEYIVQIDVK